MGNMQGGKRSNGRIKKIMTMGSSSKEGSNKTGKIEWFYQGESKKKEVDCKSHTEIVSS